MSIESSSRQLNADATNFRVFKEDSPKYRFLRVPLNNLTTDTVVLTSAAQLLEWKLPASVYNLSRSFITYQETIAGSGAGNFNWQDADVVNIGQNVFFGNGAGVPLMDLNFANNYSKVARKFDTRFEDYITNDLSSNLAPSNADNTANLRSVAITAGAGNPYGITPTATFGSIQSLTEPLYTDVGGDDGDLVVYRQLDLKAYTNTILSVDRDLYFGDQQMYLRLTTPPATTKMGYYSDSATDPTSNVAAIAGVTLSKLYLYLAIEQNQGIVNDIMSLYKSGQLKVHIPYTVGIRTPTTSTAANVQLTFNESYGRKLKRIMHTVWNNTESVNTQYDCQNFNASKIISYNTYLNSQQLQDMLLYCYLPNNASVPAASVGLDDWKYNKRFAKDSVILNAGVYQLNWAHIDSFVNSDKNKDVPEENIDDGLDMKAVGQVQWQLQATTATANLVHYDYATFSREFIATPGAGFLWL